MRRNIIGVFAITAAGAALVGLGWTGAAASVSGRFTRGVA